MASSQISLIRPHTEISRPPRALWVPFQLGHPFGVPGDAEFQTRVLKAALNLFEADTGPLIVDYYEDVPATTEEEMEGWACPISLQVPEDEGEGSLTVALGREIGQMMPWYDLAVERRGRTTVGISEFSMEEAGTYILSFLENPPDKSPREGLTSGDLLKLACDDLKVFYFEAVTAQPGTPSRADLEAWFWESTVLADVFLALQPICLASNDHTMQAMGLYLLVPRIQTKNSVNPEDVKSFGF